MEDEVNDGNERQHDVSSQSSDTWNVHDSKLAVCYIWWIKTTTDVSIYKI